MGALGSGSSGGEQLSQSTEKLKKIRVEDMVQWRFFGVGGGVRHHVWTLGSGLPMPVSTGAVEKRERERRCLEESKKPRTKLA